MRKRFLASILSILMIVSSFNLTAFGWGFLVGEAEYGSENEWLNADQMSILYICGISDYETISDMKNEADAIVSRAKTAEYISRMSGLSAAAPDEYETLFKDLTSEHIYYGNIKAVVAAGYMQGDPDGYFRPDEPITTAEATTVLLRCLNYKPVIAMSGINKASNMTEITEGIPSQEKITTCQLFRMIYNALNSPAISTNAYKLLRDGSMDVEYLIDEDYLGFEHLLGLISAKGVLEATPDTSLESPETMLKENRVVVAGVEYEYEGDATALLGYDVNYLYKEKGNNCREIVYMYKSDRNKEFVLTHDVIDDFSDGVYTYEHNNSTKKIVLSGEHDILFNDMANPNCTEEEMNPAFGKVTFINNDKDRDYDVIKVVSYDFYVSSNITDDGKTLYCKDRDGNDMFIRFEPQDVVEIWYRGEIIERNRMKSNQLLAVRETSDSSGGGKKYIIECQKAETSNVKISTIKQDSIVTEDGMAFTLWDGLKGKLDMETRYNIYTWDGVAVVAIPLDKSDSQNVYLINFSAEAENFGDVSAKIAVVDTSQKYQVFDVAEKGYLDGASYTKTDLTSGRFENDLQRGTEYSVGRSAEYPFAQPAKISFNAKGQVNKIDTYYLGANENSKETLQPATVYDESGNLVPLTEAIAVRFYGGGFYYSGVKVDGYPQLIDTTGATIIFVPRGDRMDDISYTTGTLYSFVNGGTYTFDIVGQDRAEGTAEVMYYYYDENESNYSKSSPMIVADLYSELNAEGEVQCIVSAYDGATLKNLIAEEEFFSTINIGDVCYFKTNARNEILEGEIQFSPVDGLGDVLMKTYATSTANISEIVGSVMGTPMNINGSVLRFALEKPEDIPMGSDGAADLSDIGMGVFATSSAGVFKFSIVNGAPKVETASVADIITHKKNPDEASLIIVNKTASTNNAAQIYIIEQ